MPSLGGGGTYGGSDITGGASSSSSAFGGSNGDDDNVTTGSLATGLGDFVTEGKKQIQAIIVTIAYITPYIEPLGRNFVNIYRRAICY